MVPGLNSIIASTIGSCIGWIFRSKWHLESYEKHCKRLEVWTRARGKMRDTGSEGKRLKIYWGRRRHRYRKATEGKMGKNVLEK